MNNANINNKNIFALLPHTAENEISIKAKATEQNILFWKRGHSKTLYISCQPEIWEIFQNEIIALSQIENIPVPTQKIRRHMVRTLCMTILDKNAPDRARKAGEILDNIAGKDSAVHKADKIITDSA
jgi:hypothetical protein